MSSTPDINLTPYKIARSGAFFLHEITNDAVAALGKKVGSSLQNVPSLARQLITGRWKLSDHSMAVARPCADRCAAWLRIELNRCFIWCHDSSEKSCCRRGTPSVEYAGPSICKAQACPSARQVENTADRLLIRSHKIGNITERESRPSDRYRELHYAR